MTTLAATQCPRWVASGPDTLGVSYRPLARAAKGELQASAWAECVCLSTLIGIPVVYALVPAHTDEREAAEAVLRSVNGCDILADKGFIGDDWQADVSRTTGNRVFTAKRENQHEQTPPAFARLLGHFRERIEGVFNEVQNTGRNLERLLRKTVRGLCVHVTAKMASHTLRILLRKRFDIDVLTFKQQTP